MAIYLTVIAFNFATRMKKKKNLLHFYFVTTTLFLVLNGSLELLLQLQLF